MKISITIDETFTDPHAAAEFFRLMASVANMTGTPVRAPAPVVSADRPVAKPDPASIIPDSFKPDPLPEAPAIDAAEAVAAADAGEPAKARKPRKPREPKAPNPEHVPIDPALTQAALPLEPAPAAAAPVQPDVSNPWADSPPVAAAPTAPQAPAPAPAATAPKISASEFAAVTIAYGKATKRAREKGVNIDNSVMDLLKRCGATQLRGLRPEHYGKAIAELDAMAS